MLNNKVNSITITLLLLLFIKLILRHNFSYNEHLSY